MKRILCFILTACVLIFPVYADGTPSDEVRKVAWELTQEYELPDGLLLAVAEIESGFDPECKNQWCSGIMQIHRKYAGIFAKEAGMESYDLYDIEDCMRIAAHLLRGYLDKYDLHGALMCYNLGEGGAKAKMRNGVSSTSYSRKVVKAIEKWEDDIWEEPEEEPMTDEIGRVGELFRERLIFSIRRFFGYETV